MPPRRSTRSSNKTSSPRVNGAAALNGHHGRNGHANGNGRAAGVCMLPSFHNEADREALLRNHAGARADRIVVLYGDKVPVFELSGRGRSFFNGVWEAAVTLDGREVPLAGAWEQVCWHADEDIDYLELRCRIEPDVCVDRHFILPRQGHFAVLADSIVTKESRQIDYSARFTPAPKVRCRSDRLTRECRLAAETSAARLFPLSLPQERVTSASGALAARGRDVELKQSGAGNALFVPLLIGWDPKLSRAAADWSRLTVGEVRSALPASAAAGFRLRLGRKQWVVYRSLAASGHARSILGYHTHHETVVGEFTADGVVKPLVEIEAETAG